MGWGPILQVIPETNSCQIPMCLKKSHGSRLHSISLRIVAILAAGIQLFPKRRSVAMEVNPKGFDRLVSDDYLSTVSTDDTTRREGPVPPSPFAEKDLFDHSDHVTRV